jgi:putative Holliday junction resolvase
MGRTLGVDPGEARLGLAISDPTGVITRPLAVLRHTSRQRDAEAIARIASEQQAERIVVGVALDLEGNPGPQARRALRLVAALRVCSGLPVDMWDESGTTLTAERSGGRSAPLDARAAAVILEEYLDAHRTS